MQTPLRSIQRTPAAPASMMLIGGPTLSGDSRVSASSRRRAMSTPGNIESTCCWPLLIFRVAADEPSTGEPFEVQGPRGDDDRVVLDAGDQEPNRDALEPLLVARHHELDGFLVPEPLLEVLPRAVAAFAEELRQAGQLGPDHAGQRVGALLHRAGPRGAGLGEGGFDGDGAALRRHEAGDGHHRVAVALDLADFASLVAFAAQAVGADVDVEGAADDDDRRRPGGGAARRGRACTGGSSDRHASRYRTPGSRLRLQALGSDAADRRITGLESPAAGDRWSRSTRAGVAKLADAQDLKS